MKKLLLSILLLPAMGFAQTSLFSDNFENGTTNWTLNAPAMNDEWIVNNSYTAGILDLGIFQIPMGVDTPDQPTSITGGPQSNYLHINSPLMCSSFSGCNANNGGTAVTAYAPITQSFSTLNQSNVTFQFQALVGGKIDSAYAYVEYSLDNTTWSQLGNSMLDAPTWQAYSLTNAALDNQATVYFRFVWKNLGSSNFDHSIGIDEVKIIAEEIINNTIEAVSFSTTSICEASTNNFNVTFNATDVFGASNAYIAEISDATGSFTTPTTIGTLTSAANGTLSIPASIPGQLVAGNGYLIRVKATSPQVQNVGTQTFTIHPKPVVTVTASPTTIELGQSSTLTAAGAVSFSWSPASVLNTTTGPTVTATPTTTTSISVVGTNAYGCVNTGTTTITVNNSVAVKEIEDAQLSIYPNPASDMITVTSANNATITSLSILSLDGKLIKTVQHATVSVNDLPKGIYILAINLENTTSIQRINVE